MELHKLKDNQEIELILHQYNKAMATIKIISLIYQRLTLISIYIFRQSVITKECIVQKQEVS